MTARLTWGTYATCGCMALVVLAACSTILGVEKGEPYEDAGSSEDATPVEDVMGSSDAGCDAGKPDPNLCNGRCGKLMDSCGNEVDCGKTCAGNGVCNEPKHLCECTAPNWCTGRCGKSIDYCGVEQTCTCPTGTVCNTLSGFCGNCVPNPLACNGKNCGYADNGCAKQSCGTCGANQFCRLAKSGDTAGNCCTPGTREQLCAGKCDGLVIDACNGRIYDCSTVNQCPATEECKNDKCCLKEGQPCDLAPGAKACCNGHCAAPMDAGDGEVTPQVCVP
ncbi:hypothetical protein LZC95_10615 [Pendulispora brunnea]|uniref:Tryptophan synthase alpha chain n=1 Tax=Pendulispora brunnea TaxID=2905690 RepID=A0ABZ2KF45_9BACT